MKFIQPFNSYNFLNKNSVTIKMSKSAFTVINKSIYPQNVEVGDAVSTMAHLFTNIGIDCIVPKGVSTYDKIVTDGIITLVESKPVSEERADGEPVVQEALKVIYPKGPRSSNLKYSHEQFRILFHSYYVEDDNKNESSRNAKMNTGTGSNYIRKVIAVIGDKGKTNATEKASRNRKLVEKHTKFLVEYYEDNEFSLLKDAYCSLRSEFDDLDVADSTIYAHLRKKCCLVIKSVDMKENVDLGEQYSIMMDDIDILNDCIFLTTKQFYMFERESFGWSRSVVGRKESELTENGGISFKLVASFCNSGVIHACLNTTIIKESQSGTSETITGKKGNVYTEFIDGMMGIIRDKNIKNKYVVVDFMGSNELKGVRKIIESFGYKCLAVNSLSTTDDFWITLKGRIPRHHVDHKNLFVPRLKSALTTFTASDCCEFISRISKEDLSG